MRQRHYWVVKANPGYPAGIDNRGWDMSKHLTYCIDHPKEPREEWLQKGRKIDDTFEVDDLIFAWRSNRRIGIVGLGLVEQKKPFENGKHWFEWKPLCVFSNDSYITINEIRSALRSLKKPEARNPRFIQPGIPQTVYKVTSKQAEILNRLIVRKLSLDLKAGRTVGSRLAHL